LEKYLNTVVEVFVTTLLTSHIHATLPCVILSNLATLCQNCLGIGKGHKNVGMLRPFPWDGGHGGSLETCLFPPVLPCQIWSFWVKPYGRNCGIHQINLTPHVPPFRVTQGHWNWHESISYL